MMTKQAKHTKPPWLIDERQAFLDGSFEIISAESGGTEIAKVHGSCIADDPEDLECRANACLIAAAPELLVALGKAHDALSEILEEPEGIFLANALTAREHGVAACAASMKAIAKAEGAQDDERL